MILNAKARGFLKQFGAGLAAANGLDGGEESNYSSLSDPKETQLRDALLESSDFLNWITVADVDQLSGQVVSVGASGLHTGRIADGRFRRNVGVSGNEYKLVETDSCAALRWDLLSIWANAGSEEEFFQRVTAFTTQTNAYLLLDSGETSQPFIDAVNEYITTQGHHGHGDDLQCMAMPETQHNLTVTLYVTNPDNMTAEEKAGLTSGVSNLIRSAFRQNAEYNVKRTWPYSRFSFSNLARELHKQFDVVESLAFSLGDIVSELSVPRLATLKVEVKGV
ncbi:P2 family phage major capsid protein [Rahnella laticis]|uniref:P2 family phage major capsid protein n=1 Tax=Rahnella laticis TaxID=2787622 RepID=UPI001E429EC9|nr:P2 family phage major capsid protein [Rahnella laticis]